MAITTLGENALALAARGIPVFPCGPDKAPLTPHGFHDATTGADAIQQWWARWPDALVGVPTGRISGMVVVDVDPDGIAWARDNWVALGAQRIHVTRRGWHLVYICRADCEIRCSAGQLAHGVDVRGEGGYIIWWPAIGLEVSGGTANTMPQWLEERVRIPAAVPRPALQATGGEIKVGEGQRNDFLSREAYRQRKQGASVEEVLGILRTINAVRCDPPLDDAEVRLIAQGKARVTPSPEPGPSDVGFGKSPLPPGVSPIQIQPHDAGVELLCAASIRPEAICWLWNGWLARGKLAILAGVAGTGKSTVAFCLSAVVTTAGTWPDGSRCSTVGNVLIWSAEDDAADTIVPRLIAAGADLNRVHIIRGKKLPDGQPAPFDPAHDVPDLARKIEGIGGAALLIVDPIVSAVAGDMHKANEVRRSLQALVDLAAQFDCAVLGISHFAKGSKGTSPQERVIGSQAFGALARLVLVCAKNEDDDTRVFARAKSNISADTGGFNYSIVGATVQPDISATRVEWGEALEGSARAILRDVERDPDGDGDHGDDCSHALNMALRDTQGRPVEMTRKEVVSKLKAEGYSEKVIRTARENTGVKSRRQGFGQEMKSYWRLPDEPLDPKVVFAHPQPLPAGAIPLQSLHTAPVGSDRSSAASPFVPSYVIPAQPTETARMATEGTNAQHSACLDDKQ